MKRQIILLAGICLACWIAADGTVTIALGEAMGFDGWSPSSPRDEIRPDFAIEKTGGPDGQGGLVIAHDDREGLDGAWTKTFDVEGGNYYRITAHGRVVSVPNPRYHTYVELMFHDPKGGTVRDERVGVACVPYFVPDVGIGQRGWMKFTGVYYAPVDATHATVRLDLRWAPGGQIEWGDISLAMSSAPTARKVRLAATNFLPRDGKSALDNCRQFEPYIAQAAEKGADLLVLGECITSMGNDLTYIDAAERIPGPCTDYLASLAKKHNLHIVTSLHERAGHLIYNTAILVGPEGHVVGKYRKICPARGEYRMGIAPGYEFPVFETGFGKVGMMICMDVHFPEIARGLAANGAEIIALPIMGGHPDLARARALDNQVYLVSATYAVTDDWMQTGVWGLSGDLLARATEKNSVVVAEVDLAEQHFWHPNMGEFKNRLRHERPAVTLPK